MSEKARVFLAVDPSPGTLRRLAQVQEAVKGLTGRLGWKVSYPKRDKLHLTLKFLGDVELGRVDALIGALAEIGSTDRFEICFEGLGAFPSRSRPRILWVGVGQGAEELKSLAEQVDRCCGAVGFPTEDHEFKPHLTLGRVRRAPRSASFVVDNVSPKEAGSSLVTEVTLYRSELGPGGSTYTALARIPLNTTTDD